jgi:hypothetical protein
MDFLRIAVTSLAINILSAALTLAQTDECFECHQDLGRLGKSVGQIQARRLWVEHDEYSTSIHNHQCNVCHIGWDQAKESGRHEVRGTSVLCSECHDVQAKDYDSSIHGTLAASGDLNAPRCTTCHGIHGIRKVTDPASSVYRRNLPATCAKCHDSEEIAARYDLPPNRLRTFENSYHGIAVKFRRVTAADCASCHNPHLILPPSDQRSSVNQANLAKTCGRCHPGAGEQFAAGKIHVTATKDSSPGMFFVRKFYTYFISGLITLFVIYIILEHTGAARARKNLRSKGE